MAFITTLLTSLSETLSSSIVVIAASLLLYNLTRNLGNRIARTSGIVLACVTMTSLAEVFLTLNPGQQFFAVGVRLQWLGIAFIPAAMFHLSDALLATTGLPSRGRRTRIIRLLYLIASNFLIMAAFTDVLIYLVPNNGRLSAQAGPVFILYFIYFIVVNLVAFFNVNRARLRCLTRRTSRRMGYLQISMLTAPLGIFPYSVFLQPGDEYTSLGLILVNLTNLIVILMLIFLSYPLSFFGSNVPDRVVRSELLRFLLHGPGTGLVALAVMTFIPSAGRIIGLRWDDFIPFAVVGAVLLWQWLIALTLPRLERWLIYGDSDEEHIIQLQNLNTTLLMQDDIDQFLEATLANACDYLRVNIAFVVSLEDDSMELVKVIGPENNIGENLINDEAYLQNMITNGEGAVLGLRRWGNYWVAPLHSHRRTNEAGDYLLIGILGLEARRDYPNLSPDEEDMLHTVIRRVEQGLDDRVLQAELMNVIEGLLPQISTVSRRTDAIEYKQGAKSAPQSANGLHRDEIIEQMRAALRHYWGGSGISHSRLLDLTIVQREMGNYNTPVNALRAIINKAIERLKPEGERKLTSPEWTVYNILQLRFIERKKVRDVAYQMGMSESDLYRKQRVAIEAAADALIELELEARQGG